MTAVAAARAAAFHEDTQTPPKSNHGYHALLATTRAVFCCRDPEPASYRKPRLPPRAAALWQAALRGSQGLDPSTASGYHSDDRSVGFPAYGSTAPVALQTR